MLRPILLTAVIALLAAGCESRNVQTDLRIVDVQTGWYDLGVTDTGENKLVPSVSFVLENVSDTPISSVRLVGVFRSLGTGKILGQHYVPGVASNPPLDPGARTAPIVMRADHGFTSTLARREMLEHESFVDANVTILGLHGRNNWAQMAVVQMERELLTD